MGRGVELPDERSPAADERRRLASAGMRAGSIATSAWRPRVMPLHLRMPRSVALRMKISLACGTGGAILTSVMFSAVSADFTLRTVARSFLIGMGFVGSIGVPSAVFFGLLWPRIQNRSPMLQTLACAALLLVMFVGGSLAAGVAYLRLGIFKPAGFWSLLRATIAIGLACTAVWSAGGFAYEHLRRRYDQTRLALEKTELERERAEALATMARLSSLEERVHPHFLFNALNAVLALIPENPRRAEHVLGRLAALLRLSLDSHATGQHPLAAEMAVVSDYLEIELARFEQRLRFRLEVPAELQHVQVPPFAVQTLVENAVKHVVARRREGGEIAVAARRTGPTVVIEVNDDGPGFGEEAVRAGHGLDNLRARFAELYGKRGALAIVAPPRGGCVQLTIPVADFERGVAGEPLN